MKNIMILSGSPSAISRTDIVLQYIQLFLEKEGYRTKFMSVQDFSPEVLFHAQFNHPSIKNITEELKEADGLIIGSPVYKASFTGVLKALIDLIPEGVLKNTPVLPIMVGGSMSHLLALEFSLKPLVANLKGIPTQGIFILDKNVDKTNVKKAIIDTGTELRLSGTLVDFLHDMKQHAQYSV